MGPWAKAVISLLAFLIVGIATVLVLAAGDGGHVKEDPQVAIRQTAAHRKEVNKLQDEVAREKAELKAERAATARRKGKAKARVKAASAGGNGTPGQSAAESTAGKSTGAQSSSFAQLEAEVSGEIGVAFAPLGSAEPQQLGPLEVGHAWSSFKVPIVVTLMLEQSGSLSSEQESLAASAITASDNEAAAALFSELESKTGGGASAAIEGVLSKTLGGATEVATAPPPPGAVSSWGQTEWSLAASTSFYGALACGAYGSASNVLGDMEHVIAEQQWGLGQASFPSGTTVAFKAGWGPDGSESGPYLVRQAGIIKSQSGGAVVTIAAQDASGSFEAGVSDLDQVANWVAQHVPLGGGC